MMFRPASRSCFRIAFSTPKPVRFAQANRFINTDSASPSRKPSSWKGTALRWALAAGVVYYYNTSTVFAEEPGFSFQPPTFTSNESEDDTSLPTLDSITAAKRAKATSKPPSTPPKSETTTPPPPSSTEKPDLAPTTEIETSPSEAQSRLLTPGELEEEADSEGAFNPETGEINWDCPCLGGMAHGPCGEEFRAAFSCFVYSTEEPKGMDCIDKFEGMQNCFRQHPEIYPTETEEEEVDAQLSEGSAQSSNTETPPETKAPDSTRDLQEKHAESPAVAISSTEKNPKVESKTSTTL
ncbi:intermembrane space import and assembly protein [Histoplasma capsulatum G186AR]|nr:intermembrane space import and assembly protein [Histoplasma capsulatum]QSS72011.1 intermembrane space import and assembly protein [Histoplasma capsulatum G186AR]